MVAFWYATLHPAAPFNFLFAKNSIIKYMESVRMINTKTKDKATAIDVCQKMMRDKGMDVRCIVWMKEDEHGHQWFQVSYTMVVPSSS